MKSARGSRIFALLVSLPFLHPAQLAAQQPIWENDWTVSAPPTLGLAPWSSPAGTLVAFSPDGEILLGAPSASLLDDQFTRLTAAGTLRWVVNLGGINGASRDGSGLLFANADGSAYVTSDDMVSLTKINSDGSVAWTGRIPGGGAPNAVLAQSIAVADCSRITMLDANSGQTIWQYAIVYPGSKCPWPSVIADSGGNVYAVYATYDPATQAINGVRTLKLNAAGQRLWEVAAAASNFWVPFGVDATHLYLNEIAASIDEDHVAALRTTDGSTAWLAAGQGLAQIGSPAEPIVVTANAVHRLTAASGQARWSQSISFDVPATPPIASAANGDVLFGVNSPQSALYRLNGNSGAIVWSVNMPGTDTFGNGLSLLAVGPVQSGNVLAVLKPLSPSAPPVLQPVSFASGQLLAQIAVPAAPQGISATSALDPSGDLVSAALAPTPVGAQLRVRRLAGSTGATLWETVDTHDRFFLDPQAYTGIGIGDNTIAVAVSVNVLLFDSATGGIRWTRDTFQLDQGYTYASDPLRDDGGNVYVAYGASWNNCTYYGLNSPCGRQFVVKLAAADGSTLWTFDNWNSGEDQVFPLAVARIGSDLLVGGPFNGSYAGATLLRLSGADGSVVWSSTVPSFSQNFVGQIYPTASGDVTITGSGWAKIDGATGKVLWANPPASDNCRQTCYAYDSTLLPNDDVLAVGEGNFRPSVVLLPSASGAAARFMYLDPNDPNLRSIALQVQRDQMDGLWLKLLRLYHHGSASLTVLGKFDPVSGTLLSQQVIDAGDYSPITPSLRPFLLGAPENNRLPVQTSAMHAPAPTTNGAALLDTSVTANGDLVLQATADKPTISAGQVLTFHFIATYTGDAPIAGAHLLADLPWPGHATALSCAVQGASNCVLDARSDTVRATFDMQPGGRVDVSGQIVATSGTGTPMLQGVVYGPTGLNEPNTINNFGYRFLNDIIFANGFQ